ncbi:hypothetical protein FRC10_001052, partial [Ceratobasidium sp. 414]
MPSLWERVDGVSQLFVLLPALNNVNNNQMGTGVGTIGVPTQNLDQIDFSRFDVYAPWTKHLEVCKSGEFSLGKHQSNILCYHSARRVLLPNLASITSTNLSGDADNLWVLPFLTPSLISLEFIIANPLQTPNISIPESSVVLHVLAEKCPKLQTLGIFPEWDRATSSDSYALEYVSSNNRASVGAQLERLGPYFAGICPLVSLACSEEILDPACFETISAWPLLEHLEINLDPMKDEYSLPKLAGTAFPSLKHLALGWFSSDVFDMFWSAPALVSKLVSVRLLPDGDFCSAEENFSNTLVPILSTLTASSPRLQKLSLRAVGSDAIAARYEIPMSALSDLKGLPLQALYMEGIIFAKREVGDDDYDEDEDEELEYGTVDVAQCLATMFPTLRELAFPDQGMSFADLLTFSSQMPNLESLRFNFGLGSVPSNLKVDLNTVLRYRRSRFSTFEVNFFGVDERALLAGIAPLQYGQVLSLVQYLFSLWPNVQIIARADEDRPKEYSMQKRMIELINDHLAALSFCNRDVSI